MLNLQIIQQWKKEIIRNTIISFFLLCSIYGNSQTDYEFWFAAPEISYQTVSPSPIIMQGLDRPIKLIFTTAEGPAAIKIEQPANPDFIPIYDTVITDLIKEIDLTYLIDIIENKPSDSILNFGLYITSSKPITVYYEVQSNHNSDNFSLKGRNALGTEFMIPAQNRYPNYSFCDPPARNSFIFVATEDSTTVLVVPAKAIEGHIAIDTFSIQLNRGQTWCGKALNQDTTDHLGGSFIFSDKPVAVTVADDAIYVSEGAGFPIDLAGDQLIPRRLCGNEYILYTLGLPSPQYSDITVAYVYAFEDNTEVYINGAFRKIINRGDLYRSSLSTDTITSAFISTNKQSLVYESLLYPGGGNVQSAGAIVSPIGCVGSKRVTFSLSGPLIGSYGYDLFFTTPISNIGNIVLSNPPFPPIIPSVSTYDTVPGTNNAYVSLRTNIVPSPGFTTFTAYCTTGRFQLAEISHSIQYYARTAFLSAFASLNLGVDRKICPGDSILLDGGYGRNSYLWSNGDTTQTIWVYNPGTYWVNTTEPNCNLSDTIVVAYYPFTPVNIGPNQIICSGDSIQLNAGPGRAWYQWNTGDTTQVIWVQNPGNYWIRVPDTYCIVSDTVQLSLITPPSVTNNPLSKAICSGESTDITLTSNLPNTDFSWITIGSSSLVTGFSPGSGDTIDQVLANSGSIPETVTYWITPAVGNCGGDSVQYIVTVTPGDSVNVSIIASADSICEGTPVTFTATSTNGGPTPSFQWKVNGINVGTHDSVFTYAPINGDSITCELTSSTTICTTNNPATSNLIVMTVNPNLPVSISIIASDNPVCEGESVIFTANTINSGLSPVFQWIVNGLTIGTNESSYTYIPTSGDQISCVLTSSEQCTTNNPVASDTITMIVNSLIPAGISISASNNPVCEGSPVSFAAIPINGGTMPAYQWQVNGTNAGTNNSDFTYTPVNGDVVTCTLTSNAECVSSNPTTSNSITMSVGEAPDVSFTVCFDTITTLNTKPFKLKGGIPLGGTYSGPGVDQITGYFNPAMAGIGSKTINYSYTNQYTCSDNATRAISVINPAPFSCGDSLTDIRDNKKYPTIQIGSQCWMAANLNYGVQIQGSQNQRDNCIPEKYCFNDIPALCALRSALYQWDELLRYEDTEEIQGLCPPGWHIPSEADWNELFAFYQGSAFAGSPLLETGYSGFNAILTGIGLFNMQWNFTGFATLFWSSTSHGPYKAWSHGLNEYNYSVSYYPSYRANAFSVRCLRD